MTDSNLRQKIASKDVIVGVVGLGYVGLPLALSFVHKGIKVIGFDTDSQKIVNISQGLSYINHIPAKQVAAAVSQKWLEPTALFAHIGRCDAILLCIPTPLNENREPDMSFIEGTAKAIGPYLRKEQLVVLESTTYPGTTDELLRDLLEASSGLHAGKDFYLAFSPEREDPGNPGFHTETIPKVVGGLTPQCKQTATELYKLVMQRVVPVSSTRVAEMTKLLENIFRSVNIALVNELKMLADAMDIDIWEVIDAAATKPFGFMPFYPGPGLGGHCIPIDPFYLTWKAREYSQPTRFIELAGEINTAMPHYVLERLSLALNERCQSIKNSRILIVGVAYKKDVDDMRESPALRLMALLLERGAILEYHDPYVPLLPKTRRHHLAMSSVTLDKERLQACAAVVIVTNHSQIDYQALVRHAPLIVDTRNACGAIEDPHHRVVRA